MTQLATIERAPLASAPLALVQPDFLILDKYSPTGVAPVESRINAIATISGGFRGDDNRPMRTQDGRIFIHGDAPGLAEVLENRGGKSLTIMFPSDNPRDFFQQRFTEYSATELKAYGDERELTLLAGGQRVTYPVGSPGYKQGLEKCKVAVSVYFNLAEWTNDGCDMIFPDGFGLYRLRFTSMNSLRSILSSVQHMAKTTGGKVAAIPFELFLREEEHSDPQGKKRRVWIWQCIPKPPQGIRLTPQKFRAIMESGQSQRAMLQLEAPRPETLEMAANDVAVVDMDEVTEAELEQNLAVAQEGGTCDAAHYRAAYFAAVKDTLFDTDEARRFFVLQWTEDNRSSLAQYLETASDTDASQFLEFVRDCIQRKALETEYETLMTEGEALGMKRVPLDSTDLRRIEYCISRLKDVIARRKEARAKEARAKEAQAKEAKPESKLSTNGPALGEAVHQKAVVATAPMSEAEQAEIDDLYNQSEYFPNPDAGQPIMDAAPGEIGEGEAVGGEVVEETAAAEETAEPVVPIPVQNLIMAAGSNDLLTRDILENPKVLEAVNVFLKSKKRPGIARLMDITPEQSVQCLAAIHRGDLKW